MRCVRCCNWTHEHVHGATPDLAARAEYDGWWITVRSNGQTRSPEGMRCYLETLGYSPAVAADAVGAAIVAAGREQ